MSRKEHIALFITLPNPTHDLLPILMVEVCPVLAPGVNFFLNSRNQGFTLRLLAQYFLVIFFSM